MDGLNKRQQRTDPVESKNKTNTCTSEHDAVSWSKSVNVHARRHGSSKPHRGRRCCDRASRGGLIPRSAGWAPHATRPCRGHADGQRVPFLPCRACNAGLVADACRHVGRSLRCVYVRGRAGEKRGTWRRFLLGSPEATRRPWGDDERTYYYCATTTIVSFLSHPSLSCQSPTGRASLPIGNVSRMTAVQGGGIWY